MKSVYLIYQALYFVSNLNYINNKMISIKKCSGGSMKETTIETIENIGARVVIERRMKTHQILTNQRHMARFTGLIFMIKQQSKP